MNKTNRGSIGLLLVVTVFSDKDSTIGKAVAQLHVMHV